MRAMNNGNAISKTTFKEANQRADKNDEQVRDLQKKMQHLENDLDQTLDKLQSTSSKLDEKDKAFQVAEGEIQALMRKLSLLQDELKRSESKLGSTSADLNVATTRVDEIARAIKTLETKNMIDEGSKSMSLYKHILLVFAHKSHWDFFSQQLALAFIANLKV